MSTWPPATHQDVQDKIDSLAATPGAQPYRMTPGALYTPFYTSNNNSMTPSVGTLYATALPIDVGSPVNGIGTKVLTAAGSGSYLVGIYADTGNGYPGNLVVNAGAVDISSTGEKWITVAWTPTPGLYWMGSIALTAAPTILAATNGQVGTGLFQPSSALTSTNPGQHVTVGGQSSLPTTCPATGWGITAIGPRLFLRT